MEGCPKPGERPREPPGDTSDNAEDTHSQERAHQRAVYRRRLYERHPLLGYQRKIHEWNQRLRSMQHGKAEQDLLEDHNSEADLRYHLIRHKHRRFWRKLSKKRIKELDVGLRNLVVWRREHERRIQSENYSKLIVHYKNLVSRYLNLHERSRADLERQLASHRKMKALWGKVDGEHTYLWFKLRIRQELRLRNRLTELLWQREHFMSEQRLTLLLERNSALPEQNPGLGESWNQSRRKELLNHIREEMKEEFSKLRKSYRKEWMKVLEQRYALNLIMGRDMYTVHKYFMRRLAKKCNQPTGTEKKSRGKGKD